LYFEMPTTMAYISPSLSDCWENNIPGMISNVASKMKDLVIAGIGNSLVKW